MQLVKQKIVYGNFIIDIYKQEPSINIDDLDDYEIFQYENEYGTHGYTVTLQDTGESVWSDFKTQWGVDTCLENAMHDIDVYDKGDE
tara:strand:+ start:135 stop:395 length:261 start_codon:yes stop_codon:yes gene_type:complete